MTLTSTLLLCTASAAATATPLILRLLVVTAQRDNARQTANLFKDWWIAADTRALRAECRVDLAHEQHVAAGRAAHDLTDEQRALRDATTEALRRAAPNPPRPRAEIEAEVAALRARRRAELASNPLEGALAAPTGPAGEASASPAFVISCSGSAAESAVGSGPVTPGEAVRTRGFLIPDASERTGPRAKPRGQSIPAETTKRKGAI